MTRTLMRAMYDRLKGTLKPPRTPQKRQSLIANDMHSPASATPLKCTTSIFLIANEFRLQRREFRAHFRATTKAASSLPALTGRRTPKRRGEQALFCCAGEVLFLLEQRVFAFEAPAIAGQVAVLADDAMAGNNDGDRIRGAGARDGANSSGLADRACDLGVRARGAVGDAAKLVPDAALERGGLHVQRQIDMRLLAAQVAEDFANPLAQILRVAMDFGLRI